RIGLDARSRGPATARLPRDQEDVVSERANMLREEPLLVPLLAWCSAVAVADAWTAEGAVLLGLLITGPLFAAWRASSTVTVVIGVYVLVLAILLGLPDDIFLSSDHVVQVTIVGLGTVLAVLLA